MSTQENNGQLAAVLLGASFSTGNLGVSALAWSSIKVIKQKWPNARIAIVGAGFKPGRIKVPHMQDTSIPTWPVRYCANVRVHGHIAKIWTAIILCRILPFFKKRFSKQESTLGEILRADIIFDITGGDSFSDLYGMQRLFKGYLLKRICQITGKKFILLPQTYGPFQSIAARMLANSIFKSTTLIYSRDKKGLSVVESFSIPSRKVHLCPDVAFVMDAVKPEKSLSIQLRETKSSRKILIGINISGLLYNGGYSGNNMFALKCNYKSLINTVVKTFASNKENSLLLIPHVLPADNFSIEDDYKASLDLVKNFPNEIADKITVLNRNFDQNETKFFIGQCDFFIGARMHATIAALSQNVPAIGMAYSRKFIGVFQTAQVQECVLDLRQMSEVEALECCMELYGRRDTIKETLKKSIPGIQKNILGIFDNLDNKISG